MTANEWVGIAVGVCAVSTSLVTMYKYNDAYIFDEVIYKKGLLNSEISNVPDSWNRIAAEG